MQIEYIEIDKVKPYENNPRKNEEAIKYVAESIKQFGFKVPIIIDKDNVIICGHTRLLAAERLKYKDVPCIRANDLTDEQIRAYRLADNKTSEFAEWDFNKLELELFELQNIDMSEFGFEFDGITADGFGDDFELPDDDKPQTRTITLSLAEEQFTICESVIDFFKDNIQHDYGNNNKRSNALFEAVYEWAEQKNLL